jgi:putative membrane protein
MKNKGTLRVAVVTTSVLGALAGTAINASVSAAAVSAQDRSFIVSNAQSNLAEIALGNLGNQKGTDAATKSLASVTLADHTKLQAQLAAVAKADGVTLPTAPNAMQMATAASLMATPSATFDLAYAQAEVMGHQMAIAAAQTETTAGSDSAVKSYATGYIPIATMHLNMAQAEVSALGGAAPTAVNAGSGGQASVSSTASTGWLYGAGGGLLLVAGSGLLLVRTRRATPQSRA